MGRRIRGQRKGKGGIFKSHVAKREAPAQYRPADFAERNGYVKGVVRDSKFFCLHLFGVDSFIQ